MIEAQILCCHPCDIPDLGMSGLKRGEERWVSDTAARNSKDLQKEQAKGNVRVSRKPRRMIRNPRQPPPPFVAQSRPQSHEPRAPRVEKETVLKETIVKETVVQEIDTEKLKADLLKDLLPGLRSAIADEIGKIAAQSAPEPAQEAPAPAAGIGAAELERVLESVLQRVAPGGVAPAGSSGARRPSGPEEPVFIPGNLVSKDTKAKIDVKQKSTEGGGGLDDAQAALRALKRQKRGNNNGNKENKS